MKRIKLTGNQYALVDDEDYDNLIKFRWNANLINKRYRPERSNKLGQKPKNLYMHRVIIGAKKGEIVDHINGNTLDNRKSNLRIVSSRENSSNQKCHRKGKLVGFTAKRYKNKIRYQAQINPPKSTQPIYLGLYDNPRDAHNAYFKKLKEYNEKR